MSHFFAYLSRMKLIERWSLMRSTQKENIQEHSLQVAVVAHALALIKNKYFNGSISPERVALLSLFHDASEVITGDLPTPVKYYNSQIKEAYKNIEKNAEAQLLKLLPKEFQADYKPLLSAHPAEAENWVLVKSADTICAYIKCLEEESAGNNEFKHAKETIESKLMASKNPEVHYFIEHFIKSFTLNLDDLSQDLNLQEV